MASLIIPPRPDLLPISKTCIYKTVGNTALPIDIYLPDTGHAPATPIMLFIHGGGWMGSNRSDYSRPLFWRFLSHKFIVTAIDYRLVPESSHLDQLEDVKDVEQWLRHSLPSELGEIVASHIQRRIVVTGASAGAQLALLTPKLWEIPPVALLSMYGPTNMCQIPHLGLGRLADLVIPPCTPELLQTATQFKHPPTEISIPRSIADYTRPRGVMAMHIFRQNLIGEVLLRGLIREADGTLRLPEKGSVGNHELDEISPLALSRLVKYPPTYQVMGTRDEIFEMSHMDDFHDSLQDAGVRCVKVVVPGVGHAFDMWAEIGSGVCEDIIRPAVEWVVEAASVEDDRQ